MMINRDVLELIGVIIGDGSILYGYRNEHYRMEISGNAEEDQSYFLRLQKIIKNNFNKDVKIIERNHKKGKSLSLYINNREFVKILVKKFQIMSSPKTFTIKIPNKFLNWKLSKHIIRGIFESDGSLYFSRSKITTKLKTYPRIEIKTCSKNLVNQLVELLKNNNFKVQTLSSKSDKCTKVYLSGENMLEKWVKEIGFSSKKNITKYLLWKKLGYYIPKSTLKERESLLKSF